MRSTVTSPDHVTRTCRRPDHAWTACVPAHGDSACARLGPDGVRTLPLLRAGLGRGRLVPRVPRRVAPRFVARAGRDAVRLRGADRGAARPQLERAAIAPPGGAHGVDQRMTELAQRQAEIEKRQDAVCAYRAPTVPKWRHAAHRNRQATRPSPPVQARAQPPTRSNARRDGRGPSPRPTLRPRRPIDDRRPGEPASTASRRAQTRMLEGSRTRDRAAGRLQRSALRSSPTPGSMRPFDGRGRGGPFVPLPERADHLRRPRSDRGGARSRRCGSDARRVAASCRCAPPPRLVSSSSNFGARLDPFTRAAGPPYRPRFRGRARRSRPAPPALAASSRRSTRAATATWSRSTTATAHRPATATCRPCWSRPARQVEAGSLVGRVGSTGRSTGSHLHYETRIDGEPVDPQRFLRARISRAVAVGTSGLGGASPEVAANDPAPRGLESGRYERRLWAATSLSERALVDILDLPRRRHRRAAPATPP